MLVFCFHQKGLHANPNNNLRETSEKTVISDCSGNFGICKSAVVSAGNQNTFVNGFNIWHMLSGSDYRVKLMKLTWDLINSEMNVAQAALSET